MDDVTDLDVLEAMDGIAILLAPDLSIRRIGWRNWNSFWSRNGGDTNPSKWIGSDVTAFFSEGVVRSTYRKIFGEVAEHKRSLFRIEYRCDSPALKRSMRLSVTRVQHGAEFKGLLYQSTTLSVEHRPPISIFDLPTVEADRPSIVTICSICAKIKWPSPDKKSNEEWIEPQEYYRRGGDERVLLSHGFCPTCYEKLNDEED